MFSSQQGSIIIKEIYGLFVGGLVMSLNLRKITCITGLTGAGISALGMLVAALGYTGRTGENYSFLNHFISELGELAYSDLAWAFNGGLFIGGLLITIFMLGTAVYLGGRFGYLFGVVGFITGVSGALVGLFPMDNLELHFAVAMTFFNMGMVTTVLFSVYVLFFPKSPFPKWMSIPGGITALSFFSLLYLVDPILPEDAGMEELSNALINRPEVWSTAVIEWLVGITVLAWVVIVSLYLWKWSENNQKTI